MFSVVFPGQGSQSVGMAANLYNSYSYVKELFEIADETLGFSLSKLILEGPKEQLDQTENTQPAIFLASTSIFEMTRRESDIDLTKAKYFAGHSLGEYSALAASGSIKFEQAIKLLKARGKAMQLAVPKGEGGMLVVLGTDVKIVSDLDSFTKNKWVLNELEFPFEIRWRTSTPENYKFWRIYFGLKTSYIISSKVKYESSSNNQTIRNLPFNNFQSGFTLNAGNNTWNLGVYLGLQPLFDKEFTKNHINIKNIKQFKVGLIFYIL